MELKRRSGEVIGEGETLAQVAEANKADLSGANLRGADLRWADLRWANLSGANLRWADLRWADLSGANLSGANLSGANLRWANLSGANLSGADLSGADLSGANLRWAGCVQMECGPWFIWITPERCSIGCQDHPHEFWQAATPESVAPMHEHASEFWSLWGEMILAACRACAKHGWPKTKE